MNSQVTHKSSLPLGIDLDDEVTVKLWNDGSITCIKDGGVGEQDEVPISKEGVAKLVAWLNKHAVEQSVQADGACTCGSAKKLILREDGVMVCGFCFQPRH